MSDLTTERRLSVTGLGYVGLPVAVAFAEAGFSVIGYDRDPSRIGDLRRGFDRTGEVDGRRLASANVEYTATLGPLADADFHIIAAPTPIDDAHSPDLGALRDAVAAIGRILKTGHIVVIESTVFPGATEEECLPILERLSGLQCDKDFGLAYSPERINPGDPDHRFETITKVVAARDPATFDTVCRVYGRVVRAGIFRAADIRTAEAAKLIENTQRDLNIALMNELAMICGRLGIGTRDVLAAAATKWNFLPFAPGLVGGHCVGVDPYYLTHRAERAGYHPEVILAGRRINDGMGTWIARETATRVFRAGNGDGGPRRVIVLGLTFKADVADFRNTRVVGLVRELERFGIDVAVHDPLADPDAVKRECNIGLCSLQAMTPANGVIVAVPHRQYQREGWSLVNTLLIGGRGVVVDVGGILDPTASPPSVHLWRL